MHIKRGETVDYLVKDFRFYDSKEIQDFINSNAKKGYEVLRIIAVGSSCVLVTLKLSKKD